MQGEADPPGGDAAQHLLGQAFGGGRVDVVHIVGEAGVRRSGVGPQFGYFAAQVVQIAFQGRDGEVGVVPFQKLNPPIVIQSFQVISIHRPEIYLPRTGSERMGLEVVPILLAKVVAVGVGVHHLAVDLPPVGIDEVDDPPPGVHIALVAGHQQTIAKAVESTGIGVGAMG